MKQPEKHEAESHRFVSQNGDDEVLQGALILSGVFSDEDKEHCNCNKS